MRYIYDEINVYYELLLICICYCVISHYMLYTSIINHIFILLFIHFYPRVFILESNELDGPTWTQSDVYFIIELYILCTVLFLVWFTILNVDFITNNANYIWILAAYNSSHCKLRIVCKFSALFLTKLLFGSPILDIKNPINMDSSICI